MSCRRRFHPGNVISWERSRPGTRACVPPNTFIFTVSPVGRRSSSRVIRVGPIGCRAQYPFAGLLQVFEYALGEHEIAARIRWTGSTPAGMRCGPAVVRVSLFVLRYAVHGDGSAEPVYAQKTADGSDVIAVFTNHGAGEIVLAVQHTEETMAGQSTDMLVAQVFKGRLAMNQRKRHAFDRLNLTVGLVFCDDAPYQLAVGDLPLTRKVCAESSTRLATCFR